jgi:pimeloyl-ACP methyl ester carboxylesterase
MVEDVITAFVGGGWGWLDDARALTSSWQFRPEHVATPVRWWHGELDQFVPVHNATDIVGALTNAELIVRRDAAHVGLIESEFSAAIDWLSEQS